VKRVEIASLHSPTHNRRKEMNRYVVGSGVAGICALAVTLGAQQQPPGGQTQPQTRTPATTQATTVTVEGCLVREQDVPGRKPNVAERAGVGEDYILTSAKTIKGSAPQASAAKPEPGKPVGTAGSQMPMYDVRGIDDEKLKPMVGRRVQIDGVFADATRAPSAGATEDLVDIQGTAIRQVAGECPAK
jgi:hypothetical protein